jgi:hydrogenase maturation protease
MRGDDAVGLRIIEALGPGEMVLVHNGEPASLMAVWEGRDEVVLIDAVSSGRSPGTIVEWDVARSALPAGVCHSTHALGAAEAVELARALGKLPPRFWFVGIEGENFTFGEGLSPELDAAVQVVVGRLRELIARAAS